LDVLDKVEVMKAPKFAIARIGRVESAGQPEGLHENRE
jgi:hypothetical protein